MKPETHRSMVGLLVTLLMVAGGCTQASREPPSQRPEPWAVSDWFGNGRITVGVTASPDLVYTGRVIRPSLRTVSTDRGEGALNGFRDGFTMAIKPGLFLAATTGANPLSAYAFVGGIVLAPVGAVGGAIYGAASAERSEVTENLASRPHGNTLMRRSLDHIKIEEELRDRIALIGVERTGHGFAILPHETFSTEKVSYQPNVDARRSLAAQGIDAVLDIHVTSFGLDAGGGDDPRAELSLAFRTLWFAEGMPFSSRTWKYQGSRRRLSAWAANDAILFRQELDRAVDALATALVKDVFLARTPSQIR